MYSCFCKSFIPDEHASKLEKQLQAHSAVKNEQLLDILLVFARQDLIQVVEDAEFASVEPGHEGMRVNNHISTVDQLVALQNEVEHDPMQTM